MSDNSKKVPRAGEVHWLALLCLGRVGFSFVFTAYSAALPLLVTDWKMSATKAGLIQSAWHLGFLISLFNVGFASDRFGAKRTFLWSAVAASLSALLFAFFARDFTSGLLLYGIAGLCSGGSYTPGLTLVAERFGPATRGRAMGFYLGAASLAYAISIALSSRLFPFGGWKLSFLVTCSMPAIGLIISLFALRDTPNIVHAAARSGQVWRSIPKVVKNRPAFLSMLAYSFHNWELLGMWAWLPAYLGMAAQAGSSGSASASMLGLGVFLSGLTYITSMLGSLIGGTLSDRWGRSLTILLFSCISLAFSFSFGWMSSLPLWLLFIAAAVYNLSSIADSSVYSTALTELVEPRYIGAAYAIRSVMGFGAGAISPWIFGFVLDVVRDGTPSAERLAWGLAWTSLGIGALLGPLMTLRLRKVPEAVQMARGLR
ncbi:MAG: MFS transporter [Desulfobacteraceae bacterium]|nr:MFS transporter [Desulfobacteraceae bacterium]